MLQYRSALKRQHTSVFEQDIDIIVDVQYVYIDSPSSMKNTMLFFTVALRVYVCWCQN